MPILFVIVGTILEWFGNGGKVIQCFSLIANTKILFRIVDHQHNQNQQQPQRQQQDNNDNSDSRQFQYIHGIRAINSFYMIFCHSFGLMMVPLFMRVSLFARYPRDMKETVTSIGAQPIFNGALVVQTFFTMRLVLCVDKIVLKFFLYFPFLKFKS